MRLLPVLVCLAVLSVASTSSGLVPQVRPTPNDGNAMDPAFEPDARRPLHLFVTGPDDRVGLGTYCQEILALSIPAIEGNWTARVEAVTSYRLVLNGVNPAAVWTTLSTNSSECTKEPSERMSVAVATNPDAWLRVHTSLTSWSFAIGPGAGPTTLYANVVYGGSASEAWFERGQLALTLFPA